MAEFIYDIGKRNEWIARYEEQKNRILGELRPGEVPKQCIDAESFSGRYYNPMWVVTSEGRLWSLDNMRWKTPYAHERNRRWYAENTWSETLARFELGTEKKTYYHQIVANYFCDKKAIEIFGENNCVPHHKFRYHHLLDDGIVQDRETDCMWNNRAKHLCWVSRMDHAILNYIQDARNTRRNLDEVVDGLMKGIQFKDEDGISKTLSFASNEKDTERQKQEIKNQWRELFTGGKFYTILDDENGNPTKRDNWTAIWYEYRKENDNIVTSLKYETQLLENGTLPYLK